jgi:hypothetical protein
MPVPEMLLISAISCHICDSLTDHSVDDDTCNRHISEWYRSTREDLVGVLFRFLKKGEIVRVELWFIFVMRIVVDAIQCIETWLRVRLTHAEWICHFAPIYTLSRRAKTTAGSTKLGVCLLFISFYERHYPTRLGQVREHPLCDWWGRSRRWHGGRVQLTAYACLRTRRVTSCLLRELLRLCCPNPELEGHRLPTWQDATRFDWLSSCSQINGVQTPSLSRTTSTTTICMFASLDCLQSRRLLRGLSLTDDLFQSLLLAAHLRHCSPALSPSCS